MLLLSANMVSSPVVEATLFDLGGGGMLAVI
jgi:hypothetical protein